jgi:hypothetical protein
MVGFDDMTLHFWIISKEPMLMLFLLKNSTKSVGTSGILDKLHSFNQKNVL